MSQWNADLKSTQSFARYLVLLTSKRSLHNGKEWKGNNFLVENVCNVMLHQNWDSKIVQYTEKCWHATYQRNVYFLKLLLLHSVHINLTVARHFWLLTFLNYSPSRPALFDLPVSI